MSINVVNPEADRLVRRLARIEGVGLTEAIVIAATEALATRRGRETATETAERLLAEYGITLTEQARKPLPKSVYDEMSGEDWQD